MAREAGGKRDKTQERQAMTAGYATQAIPTYVHKHRARVLVESPTTLCGAAQAWYLVLVNREMIICRHARTGQHVGEQPEGQRVRTIGDLTAELNVLLRVNHDLLLPADRDDFRGAVRVARMVDESTTSTSATRTQGQRGPQRTQDCPSS